ncbi:MAG: hypothetical protein ACP5D7_22010 [Limnospira sp.]
MKSRSPHPHHKQSSNSLKKLRQPRPLILAMMLTGVLVIETYPTAVQTIARTFSEAILTSQIAVAENPTPSPPQVDPPPQKPIAARSTCDWGNICDIPPLPSIAPVPPNLLFVSQEKQLKPLFPDFWMSFPAEKQPRATLTQTSAEFPADIAAAVRQEIARREGIDKNRLEIVSADPQTWPDTCLGLAAPDEFCGQMLVEGWRVKVSDGDRTWIYRTDGRGNTLRPEPEGQTEQIPPSVASAVFDAASRRLGFPHAAFRIADAEAQTWPDGCLGLSEPGTFCTQALVPGWQVTVSDGNAQLVYRTDRSGSTVKLDREASQTGDTDPLNLLKTSPDRLLSSWTKPIAFRGIAPCDIPQTTHDTRFGQECEELPR